MNVKAPAVTDSPEGISKSKSNWFMERRHHFQSHSERQQRRNHSLASSSSSSNQSRNNRFSFSKSSSSSSSSSGNDVRDSRRETQEDKQEEAIVGTCPFMCPGKLPNSNPLHIIIFNFCSSFTFLYSFIPFRWFDLNNFIIVLLQTNPEEERLQRQRLRDLAVFERLNGDPRNSSPALAVKKVACIYNKLVLLLLR